MEIKDYSTLSNDELVREVTGRYITMPNGLRDLLVAPELLTIDGNELTPAVYRKVSALSELSHRLLSAHSMNFIKKISGPDDTAAYLMPILRYEAKEKFVVLLLNTQNQILGHRIVSTGTLTASIVHPREVFKEAIKANARSIIVAHNHPSGNPLPSSEDNAVTKRLSKAGSVMDIPVLDHIIIGDNKFYSMKEHGIM